MTAHRGGIFRKRLVGVCKGLKLKPVIEGHIKLTVESGQFALKIPGWKIRCDVTCKRITVLDNAAWFYIGESKCERIFALVGMFKIKLLGVYFGSYNLAVLKVDRLSLHIQDVIDAIHFVILNAHTSKFFAFFVEYLYSPVPF